MTVEVQQEFAVTVSRVPDKLFGEPPTTVTFDAGHATASLSLPTVDDALPDHDVVVTVAIGAGPDYSPGPSAATATVLVREDDPLIVRPVFTVLEGPDAGNPVPPDFANGLAEGTTFAVGISTETNGLLGGSVTFEIRLVEGTATDPEDVSLPFGSITSYQALLRRTSIITEGDFRQRSDGTFFQKTTASIVVSINNDGITEPNETFSIQVVPVSAEWPATVEAGKTAILQAVIGDTTPPALVPPDAATVDGTTLTVTFDEALDPASVPPGSAFTVTVGGTAVALASTDPVAVRGRTVTLTLAAAVPPGDTVTVSYTVPTGGGARPVQDAVGNDAVGFSRAVTNVTRAHYAQGFTTGTHAPGYALTSVGLDFTSPFAPVVEVWAADGAGLPRAVLWRLDPRRGAATMFDAAAGSKLDANTTYFVYASFGGPPETNDIVFAGGDSPSGWTIASDRYERSQLNAGAWALSGAEQALRIKLEATALAVPGAAPGEPADADVSWKTSLTVGNLMRQGYREWERGYRRQWCIEQQVEDDPENIEDRTNADWCYGAIADQNFVIDGTTYELEGVYHYTAERNDQLNVDFTEEVDLSALADQEFLINGVTFAVNDRSGHHRTRGNSLIWAAPQWTASMGWTVGSTIWVGLKAPPSSTAQTAPTATVTRTGQGPVHGPFDVRVAFSEDVTGFEAADISAENGAVVEDSVTAVEARTWTAQIAPAASGTVSVSVPADAAHAGQIGNTASDALTVEADLSVPAVTVTRRAEVPVAGPFSVRVTFSKAVTGFAIADLSVEGGTATGLVSPTGETWHDVLISPSDGAAAIAVTVPAGVVEDVAGRPNGASETLRIAVAGAGFTARFEELPESHDGASAFTVELHFSETPSLSYRTVQGGLLEVTGGSVTRARRLTQGSDQSWEVTVTPSGESDVDIRLPARACSETNAVCIDGQPLAKAASATVRRAPFTASFANVPAEHDGETPFEIDFRLSHEADGLSYRTVKDGLFDVTGGHIESASRREPGSNLGWNVRVAPDGMGDVTMRVRATTDCASAPGVCTAGGRRLEGGLNVLIAGPAPLSAEAKGGKVTLTWASPRDGFGRPHAADYVVTVNGAPRGLASASLSGRRAVLLLDAPVLPEDAVAVSYLGSAMHPLADATGTLRSAPWFDVPAANLTARDDAVEDLTLLAGLHELRRLDLSGNRVTNLTPLLGLPNLEVLLLNDNAVEDLTPLAGLHELRRLDLSGNRVEDLTPLLGLPNLEVLLLNDNAVANAWPLAGLHGLESLDLSGNRVADLWPLVGLHELRRLDLSGNRVEELTPLLGLPNLEVLLLNDNAVANAWPLAGLHGLESLDLSGNRVADLWPLAGLHELRRLDLSGNRVEELTPLLGLPNLEVLLLNDNAVANAWPLAGLHGLESLDLSGNRVADLWPLAGLHELRRLDLSGNRVEELTPLLGLPNLEVLLLNDNAVANAWPLAGLHGLESLDLSGNRVADLWPLAGLHELRRLDLSGNRPAEASPLGALGALVWLNVADNPVVDAWPLGRLVRLRWLGPVAGSPRWRAPHAGSHRRSGDPRGRRPDGPDGDGAPGSAHDFDPWARGAGERIGEGALERSHRRDAPL